jgi:hypothetical protein
MEKLKLLQEIRQMASRKQLSREEVLAAFEGDGKSRIAARAEAVLGRAGQGSANRVEHKMNITDILYYIGGAIVLLGISILIMQNWSTFNIVTKILVTLGVGIAAYIVGALMSSDKRLEGASRAFFFIFSVVTPFGMTVVLDHAGYDVGSTAVQSVVFGLLVAAELVSYFAFKKNVFLLFAIIFGTNLFFSFTGLIIEGSPTVLDWKFFEYRALAVGLSYAMLGYGFKDSVRRPLIGPLYGFGSFIFLGAALALGGWNPDQNVFWELIYPGLVFGVIFLSIHLRSKAFLTFGSIFLVGYIFKITSEYFTQGYGWPLALVVAGLTLVGVGYLAFHLNRKYMQA